jgi:GH24 family phage-related lysozyme (muramidase)
MLVALGGMPVDPVARQNFPDLMMSMGEGFTDWGYPDDVGNITIGRGNLIPNLTVWCTLYWVNLDGSDANSAQVQTAWLQLHNAAAHVLSEGKDKWPGGGAYKSITSIRATKASLDALAYARLDAFDATLTAEWPGYQDAPPPAQSALMRLIWACGGGGFNPTKWPKLYAFWCAKDYAGCATECDLPSVAKTEPKANEMERELFRQAAEYPTEAAPAS